MAKIVFMTTGLLHEPWGHPQVREFEDRIAGVFGGAASCQGFLGLRWPPGDSTPLVYRTPDQAGRTANTLTVWQDLESAFAFAYAGLHAEAMGKRQDWFAHSEWPGYAAWWVPDDHEPTWPDVHAHFDRLCHDGPSPDAFDFKHAFGPDGQPYQLDREAAKVLMRRNKMQGVLTGYLGAWNEPDAATRRLLLDRVWAPDGHYTDPGSHATDLAGLDAIIGAFHAANPGAVFSQEGDFDLHHSHVRFFWHLTLRPGVELRGMDYAQVNAAGQIKTIVGFF